MSDRLKVLWVAAESAPFIKVGGLGDVSGALPGALSRAGANVVRIMPRYLDVHAPMQYETDLVVEMGFRKENVVIRRSNDPMVPTLFVDHAHAFGRPGVYGYGDDAWRFSLFCLSVFEWLKTSGYRPDIVHLNDWHSAPLAVLLKNRPDRSASMARIRTLLTVHSFQYQGEADRSLIGILGLPDSLYHHESLEYYGRVNLLKGGLIYSDGINTVSPAHSAEVLSPGGGFGLDGVLRRRRSAFSGILNGIDTDRWNPASDPALARTYSADHPEGKADNRLELERICGFKTSDAPIFGFVGRLVDSKGMDLMLARGDLTVSEDIRIVFLGTGDRQIEDRLTRLAARHPDRIHVKIGFDETLAAKIYAGSDFFLMPSLHEPCGLSQMIAMRYGSLPIVRRTGGLIDTVRTGRMEDETGFAFLSPTPEELLRTIRQAVGVYRSDPARLLRARVRAMREDFGWGRSAEAYLRLYMSLIGLRRNLTR